MNQTTERNKLIKKALLKRFDAKDVSVKGDRGTAYGWVKVKVELDKPQGCTCKFETKTATWAKEPYDFTYRTRLEDSYYCDLCLKKMLINTEEMNKIVYGCGAEFGHYYADDGYDTKSPEVITQVEIRI